MNIKKTVILTLILILIFPKGSLAAPDVVARSAILIDSRSGEIVYAKNIHEKLPPASTTKILTGLIVLEKGNLEDTVKVSKKAYEAQGSSIYLQEGEEISVKNLLYGLLLSSGNDTAIALAEYVSGSVENFVNLMNQKAWDLGARESHFSNPNGLPDDTHYTTAYDLAIISRVAMQNPKFREIVSTKVRNIPRQDDKTLKRLINHNKLLWRYEGANGIKTGYTVKARQCLVASAKRGDQEFIAVLLASEGRNVWQDAITLLDYGFENFKTIKGIEKEELVKAIGVSNSNDQLKLVTRDRFFYTLPKDSNKVIEKKIIIKRNIEAPIAKGEILGKMIFALDGKELGYVDLVAQEKVSRKIEHAKWGGWVLVAGGGLAGVALIGRTLKRRSRRRYRTGRIQNYWYNRNYYS